MQNALQKYLQNCLDNGVHRIMNSGLAFVL